jgi:hypothetical protein
MLSVPGSAWAVSVTIDTSSLVGTSAQLVFDFISGGSVPNSATISGFSTDGTLGISASVGAVTGSLPGTVTLVTTQLFNEEVTQLILGTTLSFFFGITTTPPSPGFLPDALSVFLLDPTTGLPLFVTTDPTGAGALFVLDVDGSRNGMLTVFSAPGGEATVTATAAAPVSAPATLMFLTGGVVGLLLWRRFASVRRMVRPGS